MMGFNTTLMNPDVQITNLNVSASGLPGADLTHRHERPAHLPIRRARRCSWAR